MKREAKIHYDRGEWWYIQPNDGRRRRYRLIDKRNKQRMFVDGNYVSKENILHAPGNYESFSDAAFTNLAKKEHRMEGHVYLVQNPQYPGWVKVGRAYNPEDRLAAYQTSSPFRDYELCDSFYCEDVKEAERDAHLLLKELCIESSGEWFRFPSVEDAMDAFESLKEAIA